MTAREYLKQIETLRVKIEHRRAQAAELREKALSLGSPDLSADRVQTSTAGSALERQVAAYLDMEHRAEDMAIKFERIRNGIITEIHGLENPRYIEILFLRYVKELKFKDISEQMSIEEGWAKHLIRKAERAFEIKYQLKRRH